MARVSVREAGEWVSLATTVLIYGVYFFGSFSGLFKGSEQIGLLIGAVVAQVVALVGYELAIGLLCRQEKRDERDVLISMKSYRVGYIVLLGCIGTVALGYVGWGGIAETAEGGVAGPSVAIVGNAILLSLVLAESAKAIARVLMYRMG